jgi:hypothetical protein
MRYLIDDRDADEAAARALYRTLIRWAAPHADRFVIGLQRAVYDSPDDVARFTALGTVDDEREGSRDRDAVQIRGTLTEDAIRALTEHATPARAVAGDASPVEDVALFNGDRRIYALYDYGRTQMLDLDENQLASLRETLERAGFDPAVITIAPPYIA